MSDENVREVYRNLQSSQDKYIYFILASTVAAIGFSITQTQNLALSYTHIPLGLSLICWGLSFWFGCRNREYYNSTLYANAELLKVQKGQHPKAGHHPEYIKTASEGIMDAINDNSEKVIKLGHLQMNMFIVGVLFFVCWRVIEMYMLQ